MTKTFRKDTERCRKRGYDMELLKKAIRLLEVDGQLPQTYRPHKLSSDYAGCWECHLKADWLLIWEQNDTEHCSLQAQALIPTSLDKHNTETRKACKLYGFLFITPTLFNNMGLLCTFAAK